MTVAAPIDRSLARWQPWLEHAARLAVRGHGYAEPNPLVGCVILDADGALAGEGYHQRYGHAHAEGNALAAAGHRARGGTAIVTLEPCNHVGKVGACSIALHRAGIARLVYACTDPFPIAAGGAEHLRALGVEVLQVRSPAAEQVTAPFLHRTSTALPWVTLKWAQSLDGCLAQPAGHSPWISGDRSRAMVHAERGRVDAILTGMGTVLADDPLLTARNVRVRRTALRVVWDPRLTIPLTSQLVRTACSALPVVLGTTIDAAAGRSEHARALVRAGVALAPVDDLRALLVWLRAERGTATVLVEAG
ncbi:MAG: bifunctional diaminohydroxyphosphoribosylaminopyrimidine deaminase/5-amino-6-(5-phosphoribosylamino)uracil reductase RibD, partial [Phycisphaerae bacterium]|nr:bifunctional diaminohydroxyphosphoribosylaminopyrimidine deaminase/5-amino-6-(5-phosphoribosylamino)uracil reductase RibD [Phycisphaerae bacterium]